MPEVHPAPSQPVPARPVDTGADTRAPPRLLGRTSGGPRATALNPRPGAPHAKESQDMQADRTEHAPTGGQQGTKRCPKCRTVKPLEDFYMRRGGRPSSYCRPCTRDATKASYARRDRKSTRLNSSLVA